jgi:biopolymer transport protein ExbB/TolQ
MPTTRREIKTKKEVRRVEPAPLAQILGLISLIFGLLLGIGVIATDIILGAGDTVALLGPWVVALPIVYALIFAIFGLLGGLIGAALYNFFARRIGGIKVEVR